ncbi:plasma-membrane proton-efflux P-type ATPase [Microvirga sp. M2]|uniref:plasma-membrane proton-efflux P-type ATPase n=1 Tax=Microvirga sp. M2 TaxID=3073270 RepID=UPI0039C48E06
MTDPPKDLAEEAIGGRSAQSTFPVAAPCREAGLSITEAGQRLAQEGPNDVPDRKAHPLRSFAGKFWNLSAWMIELIALVSLILHKWADLWIALLLLLVNAMLSFLQEQRAATAVAALRSRLQVSARALRDGAWQAIPARELVRGDVIRLRSGDFVPADARVIDGTVQVDQSALTGESQEVAGTGGDVLNSGAIVREGEATAVVVATGPRTYFGRTTQLVASAHPKLHVEEVIARVVKWLFTIVGILVGVTVVAATAQGLPFSEILLLSLVLLISAVPVALPVMFTVSMAVGSMELGRRGVLVTRLSAAEDAANMDVVCADKTGTLTMNRLSFAGARPQPGFSDADVLRCGALASNEADQDSIDVAFLRAARDSQVLEGAGRILSFTPFSPKTRRTEAAVEDGDRQIRVTKGALRTVAELAGLDAAAVAILENWGSAEAQKGFRILAVARAEGEGRWQLVGSALLHDALRPDSRHLIEELHSLGVRVKMLTGDAIPVARGVARELGLGDVIRAPELRVEGDASDIRVRDLVEASSGFAEVFPEDKFLVVKSLQSAHHIVGMTGDGVNDAPALRQAEVGIAVSSATDVAKRAASVVLTTEGLEGIVDLVRNGRAIYQRVLTWIINKIGSTILKAGFVVIAFLLTGQFVISALGMVLLLFMTDFVKIALSTDRVRPAQKPETWNIGPLVMLAVILGLAMLAEALGLLAIGWRQFDLGHHPGQLQTFTFQTLLFFSVFAIVSIRERRAFWASWPGSILASALAADALAGILIGLYGLAGLRPLAFTQTIWIIGFSLVCCLGVNEVIKRLSFAYLGVEPAVT